MKIKYNHYMTLVSLLFLLAGCGPSQLEKDQQLVRNYVASINEGNFEQFLSFLDQRNIGGFADRGGNFLEHKFREGIYSHSDFIIESLEIVEVRNKKNSDEYKKKPEEMSRYKFLTPDEDYRELLIDYETVSKKSGRLIISVVGKEPRVVRNF